MKLTMSNLQLSNIIKHARDREYMSGVERDALRVKATGEVFTPTKLVEVLLTQLPLAVFTDPTKTFLDNSCGDGQFLSEVLIRKLESLGKDTITDKEFETALSSLYGVDLMLDNVEECRNRLLCGQEHLRHIVKTNIVRHNALTYDYSFNGTDHNAKDAIYHDLIEKTS